MHRILGGGNALQNNLSPTTIYRDDAITFSTKQAVTINRCDSNKKEMASLKAHEVYELVPIKQRVEGVE